MSDTAIQVTFAIVLIGTMFLLELWVIRRGRAADEKRRQREQHAFDAGRNRGHSSYCGQCGERRECPIHRITAYSTVARTEIGYTGFAPQYVTAFSRGVTAADIDPPGDRDDEIITLVEVQICCLCDGDVSEADKQVGHVACRACRESEAVTPRPRGEP